jgi:hypothetical protein
MNCVLTVFPQEFDNGIRNCRAEEQAAAMIGIVDHVELTVNASGFQGLKKFHALT